jgi:hypothetical protein
MILEYLYTQVITMELKIIKAGRTGTGILIEQDAGFISPTDERNRPFIREFLNPADGKGTETLIVYVVLQKYNVKNRNGRIYGEELLKRQNEIFQQAIRERRAIGELDHPESSVISGDRISHNIIETWWEGHTLMGKMEILMTRGYKKFGIVSTKGDQTAWLLENNIMIGVSSRGVGSLKEVKGDFIVQDDFELICWDVVTAPSTPGSWIFKDKTEARPYVETLLIKKPSLNENLDRFLLNL